MQEVVGIVQHSNEPIFVRKDKQVVIKYFING